MQTVPAPNPPQRLRVRVECPSCLRLLFMACPDHGTDIQIKCRHGDCKAVVVVSFPEGPRVLHKPD